MNTFEILLLLLGTTYILFIPGMLISFLLFTIYKIDWVERIVVSFALSFTVVPLMVFYSSLLGIQIGASSILIEVLILNIILSVFLFVRYGKALIEHAQTAVLYVKEIPVPVEVSNPKTIKNRYVQTLHKILKEIFQVSLMTYLILLVVETIKPNYVTYFFNPNILLCIVLLSGLFMVVSYYDEVNQSSIPAIKEWNWQTIIQLNSHIKRKSETHNLKRWDWTFIVVISIAGGLLVYYKTLVYDGVSIFITLSTMIVISLVSFLILAKEN